MFSNEKKFFSKTCKLNAKFANVNAPLLPYFIKYNVHTSIVRKRYLNFTMIFGKKIFLFFKNNLTRINHCKFVHHKSHLKPSLSSLPCIVHREYFSIIFNVKKCALYSIKYSYHYASLGSSHHSKLRRWKWGVSSTYWPLHF
jgi:hypothetical protein